MVPVNGSATNSGMLYPDDNLAIVATGVGLGGRWQFELDVTPIPPPQILVTPNPVNFGDVTIGQSKQIEVAIVNEREPHTT